MDAAGAPRRRTSAIAATPTSRASAASRGGVTFEQARAELATVAARLAREYPATNAETGFSFFRQRDEMSPRYRLMLLALCGASLCMLLLTCANLANLLLARAAGRERELAVRAALGAGRERLVRQMLTESVVLALVGGAAGVLAAALAVPLLARLVPPTLPIASAPSVDLRVFAIAAVLSALTGLGFRPDPRAARGRSHRVRRVARGRARRRPAAAAADRARGRRGRRVGDAVDLVGAPDSRRSGGCRRSIRGSCPTRC